MSDMDLYEIDVKDYRYNLIYFLENILAGAKRHKLNVIQEVQLKAICRMKLWW